MSLSSLFSIVSVVVFNIIVVNTRISRNITNSFYISKTLQDLKENSRQQQQNLTKTFTFYASLKFYTCTGHKINLTPIKFTSPSILFVVNKLTNCTVLLFRERRSISSIKIVVDENTGASQQPVSWSSEYITL